MSKNTGRCPTPTKTRYATERTAQQRAEVRTHLGSSKVYKIYACPCGWFHLTTTHRGPYATAKVKTVDELRTLDTIPFRYIVACDVKGFLEPGTVALLRTPEINSMWVAELKLLWMESLKERDEARDDQHKRDILVFQKYIGIRRTEADNLRKRFAADGRKVDPLPQSVQEHQPKIYTQPVDPNSLSSLQREAFHRALQELCRTHAEELGEVYRRELGPTWPEDKAFYGTIPLKYLRYLRGPGAVELCADDTEE